jgi:Uma2 family endonuclease
MAVPVAERPADTTLQLPEVEPEQRLALYDVAWEDYEAIGEALRDRSNLRLTYDSGTLEIMTTSQEHEKRKQRAGRLLEMLAEESGVDIEPAGSMTFKRSDLVRGLEPDQCYWIEHASRVRGTEEWDPSQDPPPDVVIEIEVSRTVLDRLDIYAALGVPEVWRCRRAGIIVMRLKPDGT